MGKLNTYLYLEVVMIYFLLDTFCILGKYKFLQSIIYGRDAVVGLMEISFPIVYANLPILAKISIISIELRCTNLILWYILLIR